MDDADSEQTCSKCGVTKCLSEFPRLKGRKNGVHTRCRDCHRAYHQDYRRKYGNGPAKPKVPVPEGFQTCSKCGVVKPLSGFPTKRARKRGVDSHCKDCHRTAQGRWQKRCGNAKWRERYRSDPEFKAKVDAGSRSRRHRYRDWYRAWDRDRRHQIKLAVIAIYGGKCACCGETAKEFLSVDHTAGNGAKDRKRRNNTQLYRELAKAGKPLMGYRLLCFNCNLSRGHWGYCPHDGKKEQPSMLEKRVQARTDAGAGLDPSVA